MRLETVSLVSLLDVIGDLFSDETSIAVSNTEEYIYYRPSKRIDLKIKPGDAIKKGTIADKALTSKQKASEFIHRDVYGVPYHGVAVPFEYNGKLEGCFTAIYPVVTEGKSVITVRTQDGWVPTPFDEIRYLEVKHRKTYIFTEELSGTHKNTLQDFEYSLPIETFIRCHRSFIVNVKHIKAIYPDSHSTFLLAMDNGAKIPVSQSYSSYFRKLLGF